MEIELSANVGDTIVFRQTGSRRIYRGVVETIDIRVGTHKAGDVAPAQVGSQYIGILYRVNCGPRDQYAIKDRIKVISGFDIETVG